MKDKKKILIVDDEPTVRLLVKRFLKEDYTVLEASNGIESVNITRTNKPDLIIMDIKMPQMDGISACNIIKKNIGTWEIPIVMLTGMKNELERKMSWELGADGYITKPFHKRDLLKVFNKLL
jgi:CheY-like chemotaxis protein